MAACSPTDPILDVELGPKRLELLHELAPAANAVAAIVNPSDPARAETTAKLLQALPALSDCNFTSCMPAQTPSWIRCSQA